jgi:purine-binding chemotaxis protein CheW
MDNQTTATVAKAGQEAHGVNQVRVLEGGKFLTFLMANEKYGLEILKVREIMGMMDVTSVPTTPAFVRGVINLRGKVIPVVDLRLKFGLEAKEDTQRTCIIVVHLTHTAQEMTMGIIVDEVSDVLDIDQNQIEPPPSFGANIRTDFILGMGKVDQKVMTMLDIDRVLTEQEAALVESSAEKTGPQPDKPNKGRKMQGKDER